MIRLLLGLGGENMTINERIRVLRKDLGLNQKDFGARIGLKNKTISWMEQDGNTVIEQNRRIICDKFHVSMHWLEIGEGDMYEADSSSDIFDSMRNELNLSDVEEKILRGYFELDEHSREAVSRFIINLGREAAKIAPPEEEDSDLELKRRQEIITAQFEDEKKGKMSLASTGTSGHIKRA